MAPLLADALSSVISGIVSPVEKHWLSQKHDNCFLFV